jgi:hypothetical protein
MDGQELTIKTIKLSGTDCFMKILKSYIRKRRCLSPPKAIKRRA